DEPEQRHHDKQQREDRSKPVPGQRDDQQVGVVVAELLPPRRALPPTGYAAASRPPPPSPSAGAQRGSPGALRAMARRWRHADRSPATGSGNTALAPGTGDKSARRVAQRGFHGSDVHCWLLPRTRTANLTASTLGHPCRRVDWH